jgi:hypothetical protein
MKMMLDTFMWTGWEDFINWFDGLSLIQQTIFTILLVSLAVSITVLVCIGVFYLVKYIILGIYYLLKGIFKGIYWVFKKLYDLITGNIPAEPKPKSNYEVPKEEWKATRKSVVILQPNQKSGEKKGVYAYCTDCGSKFTERMNERLKTTGITYCISCGKGFKVEFEPIGLQTIQSYSN